MKKVTLLCIKEDKDKTLQKLRDLGVLHLSHIQEPKGEELDTARESLELATNAVTVLSNTKTTDKKEKTESKQDKSASEIIARVDAIIKAKKDISSQREALNVQATVLRPYGKFNPKLIKELKEKDIEVKLYSASNKSVITIPDGCLSYDIGSDSSNKYFVVIGQQDFDLEEKEFPLPEQGLAEIEDKILSLTRETDSLEDELLGLSTSLDKVIELQKEFANNLLYVEASTGMGKNESLTYLQGFCPTATLEALRSEAGNQGWGLLISDPSESDNTPTLIKYPFWVKPIKGVFDMIGILPGYHEADIGSVFLIFFSLFFAMLIGDAGYGALFLALTFYARKKLPKAPAYPFILFGILSTCTVLWGVLTGNYFGIRFEYLPPVLQGSQLAWLTVRENVMKLCFMIGATHLTVAHLWNAVVLFPDRKWMAQIGWIAIVWSMFCAALNMVLGKPYPPWFIYMFLAGIGMILAFMTAPKDFKTNWIDHAMMPLSLASCFVDVISYIRLFAVGMASLSVAQNFNDMAQGLGISRIWTIPICAIILLAGHGLNILLCALGILVHGIRLNTLEFSLHKGMQWSGIQYSPFKKQS